MGLRDRRSELGQDILSMALEPERFQGLVEHLKGIGVDASIDWMPDPADANAPTRPHGICQGRARIKDCPIDCIELYRSGEDIEAGTGGGAKLQIRYHYHYVVDTGGWQPLMDVSANRVPRRRLFGPITGYRWKGDTLAQTLDAEPTLSQRLDEAAVGQLQISYDRKNSWVRIIQRFFGASAEMDGRVDDMITELYCAKIDIDAQKEYPTRQVFDAIAYLAERLRHHLDITRRAQH
jgi:hypothetical protein